MICWRSLYPPRQCPLEVGHRDRLGDHIVHSSADALVVDLGARVYLGDLDLADAEAAALGLGPRARALPLDVASRDSFERFLGTIEAEYGPLDVLINNAGIMPTGRFLAEADAISEVAMRVNCGGVALGMKLVLPGMIERGRGHVVNVVSLAGKLHVPGMASYVASKHAALGLSAAVRSELRGTGVSVSAVLPGAVRTRLASGIPLEGVFAVGPEAVAREVIRTCRTREAEVTVPRWIGHVPKWAISGFRRAFGDTQLLDSTDSSVRREYDAAIKAQSERLAVGAAAPDPTRGGASPVGAAS